MYFMKEKENLKKEIMVALNSGKVVSMKKMLARLCLDTGFTKKLIQSMIEDLQEVGFLKIEGDMIKVIKS